MKTLHHFLIGFLVLIFILSFMGTTKASEFCVSDSSALQEALTTAATNGEDDVIKIVQGAYNGNFIYSSYEENNLTIEGGYNTGGCYLRTADPTNTVLDGNGSGAVLVLASEGVHFSVDSLTVENGMADPSPPGSGSLSNGAGLHIYNKNGTTLVTNNIIQNNDGIGLYVYGREVEGEKNITISNNTVTSNTSLGISLIGTFMTVNITDNVITHNSSTGLYARTDHISSGGTINLTNNLVTDNGPGSGLDIRYKEVTLTNNIIKNNFSGAFESGAGMGILAETITLSGNTITNNIATNDGGGIYLYWDAFSRPKTVVLTDNIIMDNSAISAYINTGSGAGIFGVIDGVMILKNNIISNNSASDNGGALYLRRFGTSAEMILTNNIITGNQAQGDGGGIWVKWLNSTKLINNTIVNNFADNGGGLYIELTYDNDTADLYNNIFLNNSADNSGNDIYLDNDGNSNYLYSPVNLFNNDFDQGPEGIYTKIPLPSGIDPSNLNNEDPLFVDPSNNDYHIQAGSPCIDAGDIHAPELPDIDFEEDPRIIDVAPDIGADEALKDFQQEYQQDQANDVPLYGSRGCGTPPCGLGSMFQSFTPSASPLDAVELRLMAGGNFPTTGYETTIRIRSGTPDGPVLGTATTFVPGPQTTGTQVNVRFDFSPRILLTPGNTYVIAWICPEEGGSILTWVVANYDPYSGGTAFGCTGVSIPDEDFIFITYTVVNTLVGDNIIFHPTDAITLTNPVTVTFSQATKAGTTNLSTSEQGESAPLGFKPGEPPMYFDLTTTAEHSGQIEVCFDYSRISFDNEEELKLFHYEDGQWQDVTTFLDTLNDQICGITDSLSDFAIFEPRELDIEDILAFFDQSVEAGLLYGRGRGWIAKLRLYFLRKMLVMAGRYIERDRIHFACFMLQRAYLRSDGLPWPRDFVVGDATDDLAYMIHDLAASLGCEWVRPEYDVVVYSYTDEEGKSWIYIELKDDEGKPMPFQGYIIYLPDGTVAEGTLGENGRARESLDKPGTCHIIFPNLDKEAWERV